MAHRVTRIVLIVSALATFAGAFSGLLIVLQPDSAAPVPSAVDKLALPETAAPAPGRIHSVAPAERLWRVEQRLEELGVECHSGDCYPDS